MMGWDELQQSAAMAGVQPDVFWRLTWRDLQNYLEGYAKRNLDEWRRTRLQAWIVYAANSDSKDRKTITEWLPLEGDVKEKRKRLMNKKQWEFMKANWN